MKQPRMGFGLSGVLFYFLAEIVPKESRKRPARDLLRFVENRDNRGMKEIRETTEQEMRDEEARELEINYLLGLLAGYDDRHEFID